jgi:hypothetical protein
MKESDAFQANDNAKFTCKEIVSRKHRPKERKSKRFQAERALGSFQGGEEEVERGKG